ncbi:MAG: PKD domain-containing protein [Bacteroidota bacterium]
MKSNFLVIIAILFSFLISYSQNVIVNPGFETNTGVPTGPGQWAKATSWSNVNGFVGFSWPYASPDYLHTAGSGGAQLPASVFATVSPYSGSAIMGMCIYHATTADFREYIMQHLATPMVVGNTYTISFYVTNGVSNGSYGGMGMDGPQVYLSVGAPTQVDHETIAAVPQFSPGSTFYSTSWQLHSYTFTATQPYEYITIGNFKLDANTNPTTYASTGSPSVYYFIDDVSVVPDISCPLPDFTATSPVCVGDNVTVTYTGTAATPDTWTWNFPSGTPATATGAGPHTVTYSAPGTYTLSCTVSKAGCPDSTVSHTVTVNQVTANAGIDQSICAGQSATLTASGGTTYSWSGGGSAATNTVTPAVTTTYTVTVSDAAGCSDTDDVTVTVNPLPTASAGPDVAICFSGSATLTASGGSGYLWSTTQTTAVITVSPASTTTYTVTVTDGNGCTDTDDVIVTVNSSITASAGPDTAICAGGSAVLTASGGTGFIWSNSQTTGTITVSPSSSTTYSVTVSDGSGCTGTDDVTVTVNPVPVASAGTDQTICAGASATLNASGGVSYAWSSGGTAATETVTPAVTTVYTVTVSETGGCTDTDDVTVTVVPLPVANAGNDAAVCAGSSATLTASGGTSYSWSSSQTTATITVTPASTTTYTVTVSDSYGCTDTDDATVTVNPLPVADAGPDVSVCQGSPATLTASGGSFFLWSNAQTTAGITVTPITTTTYYVTVSEATGCTGTDNVTVTVNPIPVASAGNDQTICVGDNATLTASGGTGYNWSSGGTTASVTVNPAATTTYTVTVTGAGGCSDTDDVTVTVGNIPVVTISPPNPSLCNGYATTLTASGADFYTWSPSAGLSSTTGATVNASPSQSMTYTVTGTTTAGCTSTASVTITVDEIVISVTPDLTICNGQSASLTVSVVGGNSPYTYVWSSSGPTSASTITVSPTQATTYTVYVTDAGGCQSNSEQVTVSVSPPVQIITSTSDSYICPGDQALIAVNVFAGSGPPYTVTINGDIANAPYIEYPSQTTTYTITAEDNCGSTATDNVTINVYSLPPISFSSDTLQGCQPLMVHFIETSPDLGQSYVWNFGDNDGNNLSYQKYPTHTYEYAGVYDVMLTVTSAEGCVISDIIPDMITVWPAPDAQFSADPEVVSVIKPLIYFINHSTYADTCYWMFGDGDSSNAYNPYHLFPHSPAGVYNVELIVATEKGCRDTTWKDIQVQDEYTFYAPSAFSPDYDGINDLFRVFGNGIDENNFLLIIYDRWGEIVFSSEDLYEVWDGRIKDRSMAKCGTYTWLCVFKDLRGIERQEAGAVTVIR